MKEITAEGTTYLYFARGDALPDAAVLGRSILGFTYKLTDFMRAELERSEDVRLALILWRGPQLLPAGAVYFLYYLYWTDGTDLSALDEKVRRGTFTDADFAGAIKTEEQVTTCFQCGWKGHTLRFAVADIYQDNLSLYAQKHALAGQHYQPCPSCAGDLRQPIVKIYPN